MRVFRHSAVVRAHSTNYRRNETFRNRVTPSLAPSRPVSVRNSHTNTTTLPNSYFQKTRLVHSSVSSLHWQSIRLASSKIPTNMLPTVSARNKELKELIQAKRKASAELMFESMKKDNTINAFTFRTIMKLYENNTQVLSDLMDQMHSFGIKGDTVIYNLIIKAHGKNKQTEEMKQWFLKMKEAEVSPNHYTFNFIIDALGKQGLTQEAEKFLHDMEDRDILPNLMTYTALIHSCGLNGDFEKAWKWFRKMKEDGIDPDWAVFSSIVGACDAHNNSEQLELWTNEMNKAGVTIRRKTQTADASTDKTPSSASDTEVQSNT